MCVCAVHVCVIKGGEKEESESGEEEEGRGIHRDRQRERERERRKRERGGREEREERVTPVYLFTDV